ncbi:MAG: hypothetical protein IT463_09935 [Planctomycetes bacterium]|nr:hypothetical protein [Planctomycetota bacterium]
MTAAPASRDLLQRELRAAAALLAVRQVLRVGCTAAAIAAAAVAGAWLPVVGLPLLLAGETAPGAGWWLAGAGATGALLGGLHSARRLGWPTLHDAALALENRLISRDGSLATALALHGDAGFAHAVHARALAELAAAKAQPAGPVLTLRQLLLTPVLLLVAGLCLLWQGAADNAATPGTDAAPSAQPAAGWRALDMGGARSAADQAAVREAMGLKETAATLQKAATVLRNATASPEQQAGALAAARAAAEALPAHAVTALEIPAQPPAEPAAREALAAELQRAAEAAAATASRLEGKALGTHDTGAGEAAATTATERVFVPFPRVEAGTGGVTGNDDLAAQSPERRELAARAVRALGQ